MGTWGTLYYNTAKKQVRVYWRADGPDGRGVGAIQKRTLSYWPTATAVSEEFGDAYVAGWTPRGATIISRLQFGAPEVSIGEMVATPIQSVDTVYLDDLPGEKLVSNLVVNRADPAKIFVLFWESRNLWSIDTCTGSFDLVATTEHNGHSAPLTLPSLEVHHRLLYSRNHAVHGYLYWFGGSVSATPRPTVVLRDTDRDGEIDGFFSFTTVAEAEALGLGENYDD